MEGRRGAGAAKSFEKLLSSPMATLPTRLQEAFYSHYWSIVNRYDSFTTTFAIKNIYSPGQHYPMPSPPMRKGRDRPHQESKALGGEGSFCGAGAAIYSEKAPHSFVETVVRRPFSSALPVSPHPIPRFHTKKHSAKSSILLAECFFYLISHLHTSCNRYTICEALFHSVPPGDSHIGTPGVLFRNFALPT